MIGSALKKYAAENGMSVSSGVAYGALRSYAATMFEGSGYKSIVLTTKFSDAMKKQELMNELEKHNLMKEFRIQSLNFTFDGIAIVFHDNPGTMKKLRAFVDWFMPLLPEYSASPVNICTQCGMEITSDNWKLVNGIAYNLHSSCAEKMVSEAEAAKEEGRGSYASGLLGALLGGLVGAIPWAIVLYFGYMASILGIVIGWLAERCYRLFKGKNGKGKVFILAIAAIVGVVVGTFAVDYFVVAQMIGAGELPGLGYGDIFYVIFALLAEDAEYLRVTLGNIGLGLLFAFLGEWFFLKKAYKENKGFKMKELN